MVLNKYRDKLKFFIEGPADFLIKLRITPNRLSFIAFGVSVLGALSFAFPDLLLYGFHEFSPKLYFWWGWIPLLLFGIGSYLDALDGTVARKTKQVSLYGGFLDSTLDRLADGVIILGLVLGRMLWPWETSWRFNTVIGFFSLLVIMMISYIRSRAEIEGVNMKGIGFMERAERILFLSISYFIHWVVFCIQTQYFEKNLEETALWVFPSLYFLFLLLCTQTLLTRFHHVYKSLKIKTTPTKPKLQI